MSKCSVSIRNKSDILNVTKFKYSCVSPQKLEHTENASEVTINTDYEHL